MSGIAFSDREKVAKLVQILVHCSSSNARKAADNICQDPEAVMLLGAACGLSSVVAIEGFEATKVAAVVQAWPLAITAAIFTGASAYAAQRFCSSVVSQGASAITSFSKNDIRSLINYK